jgi:hypothetical protein
MKYAVVDLEMCKVPKIYKSSYNCNQETIQIGAVMLDEKYKDIWVSSATYSPDMIVDCVDNIIAVLQGEEIEHKLVKPTTIVDRDNVADFLNPDSPY